MCLVNPGHSKFILIIFCLQLINSAHPEDKHVVNEHHVIQKNHDGTQKKCPHMVHLNVPHDWFETNSWHQKCYSEDGKICGCCSLLGRVVFYPETREVNLRQV